MSVIKVVMPISGGKDNPLYNEGFDRVGCFPCLASGDKWKVKAFEHDDFGKKQYEQVIDVSRLIKKSVYTSKKHNNFEGCAVCSI